MLKDEQVQQYLTLLQKWNRVYNLTAIKDPQEMLTKHIEDSLAILPYIQGSRVLDVGSGAGLPGIPLAIHLPDKQFILLDSSHKKTRFLTQCKIELRLSNVEVVHSTIESYQPEHYFDEIVTRAFSSLADMVKMSSHCLSSQGRWLAMKGKYPETEIADLDTKHAIQTEKLSVLGENASRHLIIISDVS